MSRAAAAKRRWLWGFTPASHALTMTRDDRRLVVLVSELAEGALTEAFEGPRTADAETLLADRAHRLIAQRTTLAMGKCKGERFARRWLAGVPFARCPGVNADRQVVDVQARGEPRGARE